MLSAPIMNPAATRPAEPPFQLSCPGELTARNPAANPPGPPTSAKATKGSSKAVKAIRRPCNVSVTLTAQKPPSMV